MQIHCPVCSAIEQNYMFTIARTRILRCSGCGLVQTDVQPNSNQTNASWAGYETEADAGARYSSLINQLMPERGSVLMVAAVPHPLALELEKAGCTVSYCSPQCLCEQEGSFDCIVLLSTLERFDDPALALKLANELLTEHGVLFVSTPSLESPAARFFGKSWVHWAKANKTYFTRSTLQLLLERQGFANIWFESDRRIFSLEHIASRLLETNWSWAGSVITALRSIFGKSYLSPAIRCSTSGVLAVAKKRKRMQCPILSIIMPVYNEGATVASALSTVIAKRIDGVDEREIVVVESNSTDGSREIVKLFEGTPGVRLVFEQSPKGKGHAVRTGLEHASGDIILIQDADSEYDINDYDELLAPLLQWRELFVLGSRHQGDWKMRTFNDNPLLAVFFNLGQILFTWLMNTLYSQKMTDPFTMYKVFRRECLFGLNFECNRFDFDHELVIKLIRKGYKPFEIPVNYASRSYSEGKKVTIFGDPLLWIKADLKYKFVSPFMQMKAAYADARWTSSASRENTNESVSATRSPADLIDNHFALPQGEDA
jgi:glycosyltransferase involved in cell wall biosynthesis